MKSALPRLLLLLLVACLSSDASAKRGFGLRRWISPSNQLRQPLAVQDAPAQSFPSVSPPGSVVRHEIECAQIHEKKFDDKCAFIKEHCVEESVGMIDYLDLYYCRLRHTRVVAFIIIASWLGVLFTTIGIAASDFFCVNLSTIASILGMSESMAGVTFLAFGNGSPDVFSTFAAMKIGSGSLAVGELIGAASFISAVVAGSMAIVKPFRVSRRSFIRDVSFFAVSVIFGIFFLADGKIQWWECVVMISLYVVYVVFVIVWHWWSQRTKARRRKERRAREHYTHPEEEDLLANEEEDDDDAGVGGPAEEALGESTSDFHALVGAEEGDDGAGDEDEEEQERQAYAELSSNMRVNRPALERNKTPATAHSIRPSLVGALEFRAVLNALEKTKHQTGRPIHLRRYSEMPPTLIETRYHSAPGTTVSGSPESNAIDARHTPQSLPRNTNPGGRTRAVSVNDALGVIEDFRQQPPAPQINLLSPEDDYFNLHGSSDANTGALDLLAPPSPHDGPSPTSSPQSRALPRLIVPDDAGVAASPRSLSPLSLAARPASPASLRIPRPSVDSSSVMTSEGWKIVRFWPYKYLPPPQLIFETLFPTLCDFREKSILDKFIGLVSVPSVFLLTITLPVVEESKNKPEDSKPVLSVESPTSVASVPSFNDPSAAVGHALDAKPPDTHGDWNRWLLAVQCITAPVLIVVLLFADGDSSILKPLMYGLIVGLVGLGLLLTFTSPNKPPRLRYLFCFAGFVVSVTWISTIAGEVVGVLKAFGVIFGISDAILGLTIFAVGNSLGDLVADITVARLGFPVMALSACFGGPMLNILLGVGISGLYMTLSHGGPNHKAYKIEVSSTLIISAATLLITLLVLLIWVPMNRWMMSRRIGWTIVVIWVVSTIINVVVEVMGIGSKWTM